MYFGLALSDERRAMPSGPDQHMHYFINIGCLLRKKPLLLIGQTKQALTDVLFFKLWSKILIIIIIILKHRKFGNVGNREQRCMLLLVNYVKMGWIWNSKEAQGLIGPKSDIGLLWPFPGESHILASTSRHPHNSFILNQGRGLG